MSNIIAIVILICSIIFLMASIFKPEKNRSAALSVSISSTIITAIGIFACLLIKEYIAMMLIMLACICCAFTVMVDYLNKGEQK